MVQHAYATMPDYEGLPTIPTEPSSPFHQQRQQVGDLGRDSGNGEAVADDNLQACFATTLAANCVASFLVQAPPQIGAQQVFGFRRGARAYLKELPTLNEIG